MIINNDDNTPDKVYNNFWKGLLEQNGNLNKDQLKKELRDYYNLLQTVPKVYQYLTGGNSVSPFAEPTTVIAETDQHYSEQYDEEQRELIEKYLGEPMSLIDVLLELIEFRNNCLNQSVRDNRYEEAV